MASGIINEEFCNGLVEWSMEWSAETSLLTGKATLTVKIYLDTSAAVKISSVPSTSQKCYVQYFTNNYYFNTPAVTSKGKKLMGTVTIENVTPGSNMRLALQAEVGKIKAYSSASSFFESSASIFIYGYITADEVDRLSTSAVSGTLTLGTENTLTVSPKHADFTHTVKCTCGSATPITLLDNVKTTSSKFTLPVDLAKQNTTGTTVSVTFTTTTYYSGTPIGTTTITKTYTIPASVKPSCSLTVSDEKGLTAKYGAYVQGQSKYKIVVTPTTSYSSPIDKYTVTADGSTFNTASVITDILKNSDTQTIKAKVTDKRGRTSNEASKSVTVLPYAAPVISLLKVKRCDSDGTENDQGEYMQVTFNASVSPLNNKNSAKYELSYQTTAGLDQNDVNLTAYNGQLSVTGGTYIFPANTAWAYYIKLTVTDDFYSTPRNTGGSTALTLINWGASGKCIGMGCVASVEGAVEIAFKLLTSGGMINPTIPVGTDLDELKTPGIYGCTSFGDVLNAPEGVSSTTSFTLEVFNGGAWNRTDPPIMQRITSTAKGTPYMYVRHYYTGTWGTWHATAL